MNKTDFENYLKNNWNIYVNEQMTNVETNNNIGLLIESRQITPLLFEHVYSNLSYYLDKFEYIFTYDKKLISLSNKILWCPASFSSVTDIGIHNKTKLVSMITSSKAMCNGHIKRLSIAIRMKDSGIVDLYGRGINDIEKFEDGAKDYMFSIAVENDQYPSYFTEKIMNCFALGTIPIYLGDPEISNVFDKDGIITYTDDFNPHILNEELYYSKLNSVKNNFELVKKFQYSIGFNSTILYNYMNKLGKQE